MQRNECLLGTGAAIGVNAAFLNIITEWLSDVKLGYCKSAFYLNESFCCWGEDNGMGNDTAMEIDAYVCRL